MRNNAPHQTTKRSAPTKVRGALFIFFLKYFLKIFNFLFFCILGTIIDYVTILYFHFKMADLKKEFDFYLKNQEELVKTYNKKFIVITNEQVVGSFNSHGEAYNFASSNFKLGSFIIQHCLPGDLGYTQTFHSRVVVSI